MVKHIDDILVGNHISEKLHLWVCKMGNHSQDYIVGTHTDFYLLCNDTDGFTVGLFQSYKLKKSQNCSL